MFGLVLRGILEVTRKEVFSVPAETLMESERGARGLRMSSASGRESTSSASATRRRTSVAFVLGMIVLVPLWIIVEWQSAGSFERFSDGDQSGDWEPWILYIAIPWGVCVAFIAVSAYFDRPTTEADIDREVKRLASHG